MNEIKRNFKRLSPTALNENTGLAAGWCAISWRLISEEKGISGKKKRRQAHGKWFKLSSKHGSIFRNMRFSGSLKSDDDLPAQIILDYVGWLILTNEAEDIHAPIELTIKRAKWYERPQMAVSHPDPAFRLASWIALLSLSLGILSIVLALLPFFAHK